MCNYKSGIILKNKVVLAPDGDESHTNLLDELGIKDDTCNAMHVFVRAELIPPDGNRACDISYWQYVVDQDIVPDWYSEDRWKYEEMFRNEVRDHVRKTFIVVCGFACTPFKKDEKGTYYISDKNIAFSDFGANNDYRRSKIRSLPILDVFRDVLLRDYGDRVVAIDTDLSERYGRVDYGAIRGDILSLLTSDLYRELITSCICRDRVPYHWFDIMPFWLATPAANMEDQTRYCMLASPPAEFECACNEVFGVRPFFILQD